MKIFLNVIFIFLHMSGIDCGKRIKALIDNQKIVILGLALAPLKVNEFDRKNITILVGQRQDDKKPFPIVIPAGQASLSSAVDYWLVLCLQTTENIQDIFTHATLKRAHPSDVDTLEPVDLTDDDKSKIIPFPSIPTGPKNLYHRWWRWPNRAPWREPDTYTLSIWFGCGREIIDPITQHSKTIYDWTSSQVCEYTIQIKNEEPKTSEKSSDS